MHLVDIRLANLTQQGEDFRLVLANNSAATDPVNSLHQVNTLAPFTRKKQRKGGATYNRLNKPPLILLEPFQSIFRITRPLDNLARHVRLPLNSLLPLGSRRSVIENTPQLVRRGRRLRDLELELGTLVLGVVRVVGGLVFSGGFGSDGCGLFEDREGVC